MELGCFCLVSHNPTTNSLHVFVTGVCYMISWHVFENCTANLSRDFVVWFCSDIFTASESSCTPGFHVIWFSKRCENGNP